MTGVALPRHLINQLLYHAQQSPRVEVCGLLGAKDGIPAHCYPVANVAADPQRLFAMDPAQQIAALRTLRERGEDLFAIYHSHPSTPPRPSTKDLAQCNYTDILHLIISLQTRGVLEMRGFRLCNGAVSEVDLEVGA